MNDSLRTVDRPTWDEIDAYFAGEADAQIRERVEAYFARHPRMERVVRGYTAGTAEPWNVEAMFQTLREQLGSPDSVPSHNDQVQTSVVGTHERARGIRWLRLNPLVSIGSFAALLVGVGLLSGVFSTLARRTGVVGISEAARGTLVYQTRNAQQSTVTLSDGTRIVLNVASVLQVPRNFGRDNRTVRLTGQAYFHVTHTTDKPFLVEAGHTRTTVLGTEFGVRAYRPTDITIAVESGRIAVNKVVLNARDVAYVRQPDAHGAHTAPDASSIFVAHDQSIDDVLAFTTGHLALNGTLRDVIPDLERWYDVDVLLGDTALGALPIRAVLVQGGIADLQEILQGTFNVRVVRRGRSLTLYSRK